MAHSKVLREGVLEEVFVQHLNTALIYKALFNSFARIVTL